MTTCAICNKSFLPYQKLVRAVVEVAARGGDDDPADPARWSEVEDWDELTTMHLGCAQRSLAHDAAIPYGDEISRLEISSLRDNTNWDEPWMEALAANGSRVVTFNNTVLGILEGGRDCQ